MSIGHIERKDRCGIGNGIGYTELKGRGRPELASVTLNGMTVVEPEFIPTTLNRRAVAEAELASSRRTEGPL